MNSSIARVGEEYTKEQKACTESRGKWLLLPDTCVDRCKKPDEKRYCAQVLTWGCDCGSGRCWDDTTCRDEEKDQ